MRDINIKTPQGIVVIKGLMSSGLFDKNDREIFEDDDAKIYYKGAFHICKIVFHDGLFCLKWPDGYINKFPLDSKNLEVVSPV